MKNFIKIFGLMSLMLAFSYKAAALCNTPGSFTLNNPSSSSIFGTSINLTWGTSSNAITYNVNYRISGTSTWSAMTGTTSTSASLSGLSYGTTYQIKVVASNICSGPPPEYEPIIAERDSNTRTITTEPQAPSTNAATSIGNTSFTANWTSRTGATSYDLDVSTSSSFSSFVSGYNGLNVTTTNRSVTGLSSATRYYYRVRAVNSSGESNNSSSRTVYTIPDTPTMHEASSETQSSFVVSWNAVDRADSYRLDVSTSNLFFTYVSGYQNLTVSGTSHTVSGLDPGIEYYFRVRAYDTAGSTTSSNSAAKSTTTIPGSPIANAASGMSQLSFVANWDAVTGATDYRIDVSEVNNFSSFVSGYEDLQVSGTSQAVNSLSAGTTYFYRLRAENESGISSHSNVVETITIPNDPASEPASNMTQTSFTANWNTSAGASSYQLDVSEQSDFSSYLSGYPMFGITATTHSVTGLTSGTTYYYRVRAVNASGTSGNSSDIETVTIPGNPFSFPSDITATSFVAGWGVVTGATTYSLDVSTVNDFSSFVPGYENLAVSGTTHTVTGLEPGTAYFYRVNAGNSSGYSDYSSTREILTKPETPNTISASNEQIDQFTANWQPITIEPNSYLIDVSLADDFSSFITGYEDQEVSGTSIVVSGLTAGTTYYYRVRSSNDGGISDHSNVTEALTSPSTPVTSEPAAISEHSFTANWNEVIGASGYRLDVATASDFSNFVTGYEDLAIAATTSKSVSGLSGGTNYFYRVRAENESGISEYSGHTETITVASSPVSKAATDQGETVFTAHWEAVDGVEQYLLDVSIDENFNTILEGYENLVVDGASLSIQVSGLTAGTNHYYRVSAQNPSGISNYSETIATITTPAQTSIIGFSDHTSTKFRVSWEGVSGVDTYEIYVATDPTFNSPVAGNSPKVVQHILTETFIEGLLPNTIYYIMVSSTNTSGSAAYSDIKTTSTTNSDGSVVKPSINDLNYDENGSRLSWSISGGTGGITSLLLNHKKITEKDFTAEAIEVNENGSYEVEIIPDWIGALGMQYQVIVEDLAGRSDISELITFNKTIPEVEVKIAESFGTSVNNYQIISIPYELSTTRIQDLFEGILGSYDKSKWRLLKYRNDESGYIDYEEGLSVSNVQRGAGYWFISSESVSLKFGSGQTPSNTLEEPFELQLIQGWNQIGNPYLEDIKWSDILAANSNPTAVGSLFTYDSESTSFVTHDILSVFGGGFVFVDEDVTLEIPVDINLADAGGRLREVGPVPKNAGWSLDFVLNQGAKVNQLSGIGMNPYALPGKDQEDVLNPPKFSDHIVMGSVHPEFFDQSFARDIVSPSDQYHWEFKLESSENIPVHLSWQAANLPTGSLILYDLDQNRLVDMHTTNSYTFRNGNQSLSIYYSKDQIELNADMQLGKGFPNPAEQQLEVPYGFHIGNKPSDVIFTVYNMQGVEVCHLIASSNAQGVRSISWNRTDLNGRFVDTGMYFYKIKSTTGNHTQLSAGKIILK